MSVLNQKMDEQMPYFKRVPGGEEGSGMGCHTHAAALQLLKLLRLKWKLERHKVCHRYRHSEGWGVSGAGDEPG